MQAPAAGGLGLTSDPVRQHGGEEGETKIEEVIKAMEDSAAETGFGRSGKRCS